METKEEPQNKTPATSKHCARPPWAKHTLLFSVVYAVSPLFQNLNPFLSFSLPLLLSSATGVGTRTLAAAAARLFNISALS